MPTKFGLTLCQSKYASNILHRFHMENAKPTKTPSYSSNRLTPYTGTCLSDPSEYKEYDWGFTIPDFHSS